MSDNHASPGNPVMVTRRLVAGDDDHLIAMTHRLWCPGCESLHMPRSRPSEAYTEDGIYWDWDGNETSPTFAPSYLTWWTQGPEHERVEHRCHSFIRSGQWEFLGDCTHALAGQTVPLPPLPDWLVPE